MSTKKKKKQAEKPFVAKKEPKNLEFGGVQITLRPNNTDAEHIVFSSKQTLLIDRARDLILKPSLSNAVQLEKWIALHPNIPEFKNFLTIMYHKLKAYDKAKIVVENTVKAHPNYTFGLCALASQTNVDGNKERAFLMLAKGEGLAAMLPNRKIFSVTEILNYIHIASELLFLMQKQKEANRMIDSISTIVEHFDISTYQAVEDINDMRMRYNLKELYDRNQTKHTYIQIEELWLQPNGLPPTFKHPEAMQILYDNDYNLSEEEINTILALPHDTLTTDLCAVIDDSLNRFDSDWNVDGTSLNIVQHALNFLHEIKAETELVQKMLQILRTNDDFMDFCFGDFCVDEFSFLLQDLSAESLAKLSAFIIEPNRNSNANIALTESFFKILSLQNTGLQDFINNCKQYCEYCLENPKDENLVDSSKIGFIALATERLKLTALVPVLCNLFDANLVDEMVLGDKQSFLLLMEKVRNEPPYTLISLQEKNLRQ